MIRDGEGVSWLAAADPNKRKTRGADRALAFGLGMLSFAGWFGALMLDTRLFPDEIISDNGTTFDQHAWVSLLVHLPLMLIPAALALAFGLPKLPERERTGWRIAASWAVAIAFTIPALVPQLNHQPFWMPFRLPIYGLVVALALVDPDLRVGRDPREVRRLPPMTAALGFALTAAVTAIVIQATAKPSCAGYGCYLAPLGEVILCGFALAIAVGALIGSAIAYSCGAWIRGRWQLRQRAGAI